MHNDGSLDLPQKNENLLLNMIQRNTAPSYQEFQIKVNFCKGLLYAVSQIIFKDKTHKVRIVSKYNRKIVKTKSLTLILIYS